MLEFADDDENYEIAQNRASDAEEVRDQYLDELARVLGLGGEDGVTRDLDEEDKQLLSIALLYKKSPPTAVGPARKRKPKPRTKRETWRNIKVTKKTGTKL